MSPTGHAETPILLGKITKPHGIKGEVKVHPYSGQPENFHHYPEILVEGDRQGEWITLEIEKARVQGKQVILQLRGCTDRAGAEDLAGLEVWLHRRNLPELSGDEYYLADLEGRTAVSEDGRTIGRITGIMATGAHDILSVRDKGHEYLIPIQKGFIIRMDEQEVVLRLPPGLLEINLK
jgi:16S rRNA processing protein RimM